MLPCNWVSCLQRWKGWLSFCLWMGQSDEAESPREAFEGVLNVTQVELLPQLLKMMEVTTMTGSEGQRKLTLGNATILAYCLRWAGFRVRLTPVDIDSWPQAC